MGYFSNLAVAYIAYRQDHSIVPPDRQLLWRLEELEDRLDALSDLQGDYECRAIFSDDDLRHILPEHLYTFADVQAAIELAIFDLADQYGIRIRMDEPEEPPAVDEITGMQISIVDLLSMPWFLSAA